MAKGLDIKKIKEVESLIDNGNTIPQIAEKAGVSTSSVSRIKSNMIKEATTTANFKNVSSAEVEKSLAEKAVTIIVETIENKIAAKDEREKVSRVLLEYADILLCRKDQYKYELQKIETEIAEIDKKIKIIEDYQFGSGENVDCG